MGDAGAPTAPEPGPRLAAMLADLGELVRCESPSGEPDAVAASAAVVAAQGERALGAAPEVLDGDGVTHLRWRLGDGPRRLLVLCHHDTVWPTGTLERLPWSVAGDVVRGPGCFDMKAGVVIALHALAALRGRGEGAVDGVTVLVTGDEEVGSTTSADLVRAEAHGCEAALVLEASAERGALKTARKGVSTYTVEITGRAAHAGLEPEKGVSAVLEAAHQVIAIAALGDAGAGTSVTPTVVRGGTTTNTVAASATVAVDSRARTVQEQDCVDAALRALRPRLPGARLHVGGGVNRPPLEAAMAEDLFALAGEVADRLGHEPLRAVAVGGASDGNFTAGAGVPTLDGLGAVGGGAHADDEHVLASCLPARADLLAGIVTAVLARGGDEHGPPAVEDRADDRHERTRP